MIPWQLLDSAPVPGENEDLHLYQRGREFSIRVDVDNGPPRGLTRQSSDWLYSRTGLESSASSTYNLDHMKDWTC
jgi:hypothetical protein